MHAEWELGLRIGSKVNGGVPFLRAHLRVLFLCCRSMIIALEESELSQDREARERERSWTHGTAYWQALS